jgi:RNA polymerase sigma-70 factor (ECF subfamily)
LHHRCTFVNHSQNGMATRDLLAAEVLERCFQTANAGRWALSHEVFANQLTASARRAFPDSVPSGRELDTYYRSLHLEDLALACACAEGHEAAWDHFVLNFRPVLYRAAAAAGDPGRAREVADSLYAELFGLRVRDGERQSLFRHFHGRSSLATWLRAVLAQRCVDVVRQQARLDPLPDDESPRAFKAPSPPRPGAGRYRDLLRRAIGTVVAALAPRDRLRLRCYYAQDLTLAQIGRLLGEHEATVSRNLGRTRRVIRTEVEAALRRGEGLTADEIAECFEAAIEDTGTLDVAELMGDADPDIVRKEVVTDRSE